MYIEADSMDQVQREVIKRLFQQGHRVHPRGHWVQEVTGLAFRLNNPRSRLIYSPSRKLSIAFAIGELTWYLRGSDRTDIISYYNKRYQEFSDNGETQYGAYGRRLFTKEFTGFVQWNAVIKKLHQDPQTRQAVIHLHVPQDLEQTSLDIPCTCYIQFMIRNNKLECIVNMRSNDIIWGTAYDVFSFTMMQEIMAKQLNLEVGTYMHFAGSMHLYDRHIDVANSILGESSYSVYEMPHMPKDPWQGIAELLLSEESLRCRGKTESWPADLYWRDLAYVLQGHLAWKTLDKELLSSVQKSLPLRYAILMPHFHSTTGT